MENQNNGRHGIDNIEDNNSDNQNNNDDNKSDDNVNQDNINNNINNQGNIENNIINVENDPAIQPSEIDPAELILKDIEYVDSETDQESESDFEADPAQPASNKERMHWLTTQLAGIEIALRTLNEDCKQCEINGDGIITFNVYINGII